MALTLQPVAGSGEPFSGTEAAAPGGDTDTAEHAALAAYSAIVTAVAERLSPSVASLLVSRRAPAGRRAEGGGSAVVLTPDGFLLTSAHVVAAGDGGRAA